MKMLPCSALLALLFCSNASPAATLAVLQKNGEVYSMFADSEASVSQPKRIAQLPAEGCDFVDACGAPGQLFALRADGAVFTILPDGKVESYVVSGWDDRISHILFHDGNLYGMDLNLDKKSEPQARVLDQSGSLMLGIRNGRPDPAQGFAISGEGNPVFLSVSDRPFDETYPHVTWAYTFSPGYRGAISGHDKFLDFSNRLPGILVRARGEDIYAISEKQDSQESLCQVIPAGEEKPHHVKTDSIIPLGVGDMAFFADRVLFLMNADESPEILSFKAEGDADWSLEFDVKLPLKNAVGMGVWD